MGPQRGGTGWDRLGTNVVGTVSLMTLARQVNPFRMSYDFFKQFEQILLEYFNVMGYLISLKDANQVLEDFWNQRQSRDRAVKGQADKKSHVNGNGRFVARVQGEARGFWSWRGRG